MSRDTGASMVEAPETAQMRASGDGAGLLPRPVRRLVIGGVTALVLFACYLLLVRGPALLLDLAHTAAAMFCL